MPMTTNSEQPSENPNSTSSARQSLVRAGESAAAVDAVVDEVAVVKAVAPMLRYMSWIQSLQLYQNVSGARPLCRRLRLPV